MLQQDSARRSQQLHIRWVGHTKRQSGKNAKDQGTQLDQGTDDHACAELQPSCAALVSFRPAAANRDGDTASLPSVMPPAAAVLPAPAESAVMSAVPARARPQADQMPRLSRSPAASEMRGVSIVVA